MSFIDKAKEALGDNLEKAKELISENVDKLEGAIDRAGDFIDDKTSGKFSETLDRVQFAAHDAVDKVSAGGEFLSIDGDGSLLPAQGILKEMGYRAGKSGLPPHERREILRRTFEVQLVSNSGEATDYIAEWGGRCSQARFEKMDRVLGGLAANAEKIRKNDMSEAIADWTADQGWLAANYRQWMHHDH
jgi:hypothetical protein